MRIGLLVMLVVLVTASPEALAASRSDRDVRQAIIRESLANYPGPCPCPYDVARNGSSCGRRSAYSRPGGYSPICYDSDVTSQMIADYRRMRGQ
jgi:hypothetical protein